MLPMERMRLIVIILIMPLVFIAATLTAFTYMWSDVLATYYITLNKVVPDKIQDLSTNSASLVEISNTSNTMTNMMNQIPKDVLIQVKSSQIIPVGKESQIALLVLDKNTGKPLTGAQVVIGMERGTSMSTMD